MVWNTFPKHKDKLTNLPADLDLIFQRATADHPDTRYADVDEFLKALLQAIHVEKDHPDSFHAEDAVIPNPYKGLRAFQEADAPDFYGREVLIEQLLSRLGEMKHSNRFLAVVGPSGSGKSSVVRAGLIPALRAGALTGSAGWFFVEMTPGTHPFEELELVGEASNGQQAVQLCLKLQPDVVLMDLDMPVMNGMDATRIIRQQCPNVQIIVLTVSCQTKK